MLIPDYKLVARCGRGGFGDVWIAESHVGIRVALKIIDCSADAARELQGLRNFVKLCSSPHLVQIFHVGETAGCFFYTMELADDLNHGQGQYKPATLGNMLLNGVKFTPDEVVQIGLQLLEAVSLLHKNNFSHRDIKPENIIFVNGVVKLSDMGLLREISETMSIGGTIGFIPPEKLACGVGSRDQGDDLYALGKVLYCMLTGNPPEKFPSLPGELVGDESVKALNSVITAACSKEPRCRFSSAEDFARAIKNSIDAGFRKKQLRRRLGRYAAVLCAGAAIAAAGVAGYSLYSDMELRRVQQKQIERECDLWLGKVNRYRGNLRLQLLKVAPAGRVDDFFKSADNLKQQGSKNISAAKFRQLETQLAAWAEKSLVHPSWTEVPEYAELMKISGQMHVMLNSPLTAFLKPELLAGYREKVSAFDRKYVITWQQEKLIPGARSRFDYMKYLDVSYVTPGEFISPVTGEMRRIDYPFWIARNEVVTEDFSVVTAFIPQNSASGKPVRHFSWNDAMLYCYNKTVALGNRNLIPPGYIVRPPTGDEWEWSMLGAWLPQRIDNVTSENSLGIYKEREGYEVNFTAEPQFANTYPIRTRFFDKDGKLKYKRRVSFYYQTFYSELTLRCVIAPGDISFFEKYFQTGNPQHKVVQGRHFELLGGNISGYGHADIRAMCALLGGKAASLDNAELLRSVGTSFFGLNSWYCMVGVTEKDGVFYWDNGKKVDCKIRGKRTDKSMLVFKQNSLRWLAAAHFPVFLCEWSAQEFRERRNKRNIYNSPLLKWKFTAGGKNFAVIEFNVLPHTCRRIVELLGAKHLDISDDKLVKSVVSKLAEFTTRPVMLGGYFKYNSWFSENGRPLKKRDFKITGMSLGSSPHFSMFAAANGELKCAHYARYFLIQVD